MGVPDMLGPVWTGGSDEGDVNVEALRLTTQQAPVFHNLGRPLARNEGSTREGGGIH